MNVLIDTSAWIEFFRAKGDPAIKARVAELIGLGKAAHTCPIRYELIAGARPREREDLLLGLTMTSRLMATSTIWDKAAESAAQLRDRGLQFPAFDLLIATVAHLEKMPLLTCDHHFSAIRDSVMPGLQLL